VLDTSALWLAPGLQHPVFKRYASFFASIFGRFVAFDYRDAYLRHGRQALEPSIAKAVEDAKSELVVYTQFPSTYAYVRPGFLLALRRRSRVIGLGFDDEIYFEQAKHFYVHCDAVITTDVQGAERLRSLGIAVHLAQLQQPHVAAAITGMQEDIPVSFVGEMSKPGRRRYVQALEAAGVPVQDYGYGSRNGPLSDAEVIDVFRRSKINLNFTGTNPPSWILRHYPERSGTGQMKGRPFEIAALGRFCLCEWAPCVEYWFRPGEEIGVFRDATELAATTKRYLEDSALRQRIAAAAHERYRSQYAPEMQFKRIFSEILAARQRTPQPGTPPAEPIFYESMGRSRAAAFLHSLRSGRPFRALSETMAHESSKITYWRGFMGGVKDTVSAQLQRQ
jgi:hypothetical protein